MRLKLTWDELARAVGGRLTRGAPGDRVSSISTDTRRLEPGAAFWALAGKRYDAHDFIDGALGADGWVVRKGRLGEGPRPAHVVEVGDTLKALQALAAWHRDRFDIPVAAVAGSNGKTSTKEMLRSICAQAGPVCATTGNLNNEIGLPLSVLELDAEHRHAVFELGESHPGDIEELTRVAKPTVGVLTNVGPAHLEFFGTLEGVFRCLGELVSASPADAVFAVNLDDPFLAGLETALPGRTITYGASERAAVRLLPGGAERVELLHQGRRASAALAVPGKVHRLNAAAAAAGALAMGLRLDAVAAGLEAFRPAPMRFEPRPHPSGARLLVDAYNANPGSMRAGIESFLEAYSGGRRVVVLGDMKELGSDSARLHREIGEWLAGQPVDAVFLAGADMRGAAGALASAAPAVPVRAADGFDVWLEELRGWLSPGTAVYFKASRAMGFEKLIEAL